MATTWKNRILLVRPPCFTASAPLRSVVLSSQLTVNVWSKYIWGTRISETKDPILPGAGKAVAKKSHTPLWPVAALIVLAIFYFILLLLFFLHFFILILTLFTKFCPFFRFILEMSSFFYEISSFITLTLFLKFQPYSLNFVFLF